MQLSTNAPTSNVPLDVSRAQIGPTPPLPRDTEDVREGGYTVMRSMSLCARRCYNLPLICVGGQGASNTNDKDKARATNDKAKARAANGGGGDAGGVVECSACGETHEDQARAAGAVATFLS